VTLLWQVAGHPYAIFGYVQQPPHYFVKLAFGSDVHVHALMYREERNGGRVAVLGAEIAADADSVPAVLAKLC
jgi:hypothetical protein